MKTLIIATVAVVTLAFAACGENSIAKGAEKTIEGDLEKQIALGKLTATCHEPPENAEGETFDCTATTTDGMTITFVGTLTKKDHFEVVTSNLLTVDDMQKLLPVVASSISEQVGAAVAVEDLDCPDGNVVLDADGNFPCEVTDSATGDKYPLTIKTGGLEPGVGARDLGWEIGDKIN
ncbi:MAG: hypothetical protein R3B97_11635 [Dehalococcoidia bacterium]|nr:hypothetical protein [Dehalococcoidia bacterium]MCB9484599.1 hypothetical protein [Thermoflexaceae bacterium]